MSDPSPSDIGFKNKMASVWTTLKRLRTLSNRFDNDFLLLYNISESDMRHDYEKIVGPGFVSVSTTI